MAQVTARTSAPIDAPPRRVLEALSDYTATRPQILTDAYRDYHVAAGGRGTGSRVHWTLQATKARSREQLIEVEELGNELVERDANSSMVTRWTVAPAGIGSTVTVETTWDGAGGIGGFFERTFAPRGLARIHDGVLANLAAALR